MLQRAGLCCRFFVRHPAGGNLAVARLPAVAAIQSQPRRSMYSNEQLDLNNTTRRVDRVWEEYGHRKGLFTSQFAELLSDKDAQIQVEDLKNLIFLTRNNADDVALLKRAIDQYVRQPKTKDSDYQFGPLVLRMATIINEPSIALWMMDKQNIDFFGTVSSADLALNLLYRNDRFKDVMRLYRFVGEHYPFRNPYYTFSDFVFAAAWRLNTPEAFDECLQFCRRLEKEEIPWGALCHFLSLSLAQSRPKTALELIDLHYNAKHDRVLLQFKFLALADTGKYDAIISIANGVVEGLDKQLAQAKGQHKQLDKFFSAEALEHVEKSVLGSGQADKIAAVEQMKRRLLDSDYVDHEMTMESIRASSIFCERFHLHKANTASSLSEVEPNARRPEAYTTGSRESRAHSRPASTLTQVEPSAPRPEAYTAGSRESRARDRQASIQGKPTEGSPSSNDAAKVWKTVAQPKGAQQRVRVLTSEPIRQHQFPTPKNDNAEAKDGKVKIHNNPYQHSSVVIGKARRSRSARN